MSLVWNILFYFWFVTEIAIVIRTRTRGSAGRMRDRGTLRILWIVIVSSMTAAIWISKATPHTLGRGAAWPEPLAIALLAVGLTLRWAAVITLGKSFSVNVAIHATQTVLKTGLYGWMRHPSYTALILIFLAVGLHTQNWLALVIATVPTTAALLYRIHVEEIALRSHFGAEYEEYSRETKRLIPGIY